MTEIYELLKFFLLGLFQGFTEPIPISSSGHLVMLQSLMDIDLPGLTFEAFINFGSLIAVLIVYRKDIIALVVNGSNYLFKRDQAYQQDFYYLFLLFIATIPAGILGALFNSEIGAIQAQMVGVTLILTAIALWIIRNLKGYKGDAEITWKDALIIGFAQAVSLIPGISRSGATIVAAMLVGFKRSSALRFSFLMYIPVSLGTMVLATGDIMSDPEISSQFVLYLVSLLAAIVSSYFALLFFINVMKAGNLKYFAFYCATVGILAIIFL
ncbi:undecaprenyl-diphosphate phosphatase [Halalkalibacillus halophilus]|uniref:undecaprenyl-diphosphate phosphatase n=1 Tax=Halalkalibacillus halophilus TaxID=392827 RepID=UPI0004206CAB|nr:undecaprenyl-diphosphate phosphatase [Halalkalibacillus halophilus]